MLLQTLNNLHMSTAHKSSKASSPEALKKYDTTQLRAEFD